MNINLIESPYLVSLMLPAQPPILRQQIVYSHADSRLPNLAGCCQGHRDIVFYFFHQATPLSKKYIPFKQFHSHFQAIIKFHFSVGRFGVLISFTPYAKVQFISSNHSLVGIDYRRVLDSLLVLQALSCDSTFSHVSRSYKKYDFCPVFGFTSCFLSGHNLIFCALIPVGLSYCLFGDSKSSVCL